MFKNRTTILDVGTGGGLPDLPLAILNPQIKVTLLDSITKKIKAVDSIINSLGIKNTQIVNDRIEKIENKYDFIIDRGVSNFVNFSFLCKKNISYNNYNDMNNEIFYLSGELNIHT